ncbi:MAG TPA: Rieske 2Fe-2S domain-containing protein [Acidimicrobiales bacterium]|nr:Rieske 2Fe-2S domain-containing protein [Acidimicrobiales bacterium]
MSDKTDNGGEATPPAPPAPAVPPSTPVAAPLDAEGERWAEQMSITSEHPGRVEFFVGLCFIVSVLATIGLGYTYAIGGQPQAEGALLFVIFGGIGVGMAAWGKYLMPRGPFVEEREVLTTPENQEKFARTFRRGQVAVEGRRSMLVKLFLGAAGAMTAVLLFPIRSLTDKNPVDQKYFFGSGWKKGDLLINEQGKAVHVSDLAVGDYETVFPRGSTDIAMDQTLLIRVASEPVYPPNQPEKASWSPQGYIAFSKVCTHAGCPVGQYEGQFATLLCPCHQSTFDVLNGAKVIFGPAPRPLPQLPLMVDDNGYIRAASSYGVPLGPGFWDRGGRQ